MAISILLLLFTPEVSAAITLQAPSSAVLQETFTVTISSDTMERSDVKIYIRNDSDAVLSEIQDGDWKNGRYYVNDAYPQTTAFVLRATTFSDSAHLCAKLRLSEKRKTKPPTPESCTSINIEQTPASSSKPPPQKTSPKQDVIDEEKPIKKPIPKKNVSQQPPPTPPSQTQVQQSPQPPQKKQEDLQEEKISLNTPSLTGNVITTSQEKAHLGILGAFFIFTILMLFWIIKQEKKKREQENI